MEELQERHQAELKRLQAEHQATKFCVGDVLEMCSALATWSIQVFSRWITDKTFMMPVFITPMSNVEMSDSSLVEPHDVLTLFQGPIGGSRGMEADSQVSRATKSPFQQDQQATWKEEVQEEKLIAEDKTR